MRGMDRSMIGVYYMFQSQLRGIFITDENTPKHGL